MFDLLSWLPICVILRSGGTDALDRLVSRFCLVQDTGTAFGSLAPLKVFSMFSGFPNMTVEYLAKYLKLSGALDKLKRVPTTRKAIITVLIRHMMPKMAQHQIDSILELHEDYAKLAKKVKDAQFLSDNLEMGYGCVEEADFQLMKSVISDHKSKLTQATDKLDTERRERPSMIGFKAVPRDNNISLDWARTWMPNKGALHKDVTLHWRWKLKYPNPIAASYFSRVWGEANALTELSALREVLETACQWHADIHGQICPFDFDHDQFQNGG